MFYGKHKHATKYFTAGRIPPCQQWLRSDTSPVFSENVTRLFRIWRRRKMIINESLRAWGPLSGRTIRWLVCALSTCQELIFLIRGVFFCNRRPRSLPPQSPIQALRFLILQHAPWIRNQTPDKTGALLCLWYVIQCLAKCHQGLGARNEPQNTCNLWLGVALNPLHSALWISSAWERKILRMFWHLSIHYL